MSEKLTYLLAPCHPSDNFIRKVAQRLDEEGVLMRDANIVERIRNMTANEIVELATTGDVKMWSNDRMER